MKKRRMITYSVILALLLVSFLFGTIALIKAETFKRNTVSFNVAEAGAYCKIEAECYLGKYAINTNTPTKTYTDSYTQVDEYSKNGKTLESWNVGNTAFVVDEDDNGQATINDIDVMMYKIRVYNYNTDGKTLGINLTGIACCNVDDEDSNFFSTKVTHSLNLGDENIAYNNEDDATLEQKQNYNPTKRVVNDINALILPYDDILDITITFRRRTKTDSFEVKNNINFEIYVINS